MSGGLKWRPIGERDDGLRREGPCTFYDWT